MKLSANMDTSGLEKTLTGWEQNQLPFATASALTKTVKLVQVATVAEMRKVLNKPTPFTLNSTVVRPATKSKLFAELILKNANQKGAPPSVWLEPNIEGGIRQAKRTETMLRQKGFLPGDMFYVPGTGASLNRYGNWNAGELIKVMSALQALPQMGYLANKSSRLSARVNANAGTYFVGKPAGGRLPLGVYQRKPDGSLKAILVFVKTPQYHKILPFYELAREVYGSNFQAQFNVALRDALILSPIIGKAT
jgi:hypothetical protein